MVIVGTDLWHKVAAETDRVVHVLALVVAHDLVVGVEVQLVGGRLRGAEGAPAGEGRLGTDLELVVLRGHVHRNHGTGRGVRVEQKSSFLVASGHTHSTHSLYSRGSASVSMQTSLEEPK